MNSLDLIISQAPVSISIERINEIYLENNKDYIKTLMVLWEIEEKKIEKKPDRWDDVREICDSYDIEMDKYMKDMKNKMMEKKIDENTIISNDDNYITSNI